MVRSLAGVLIRLYQLAKPAHFRGHCRYTPSCSEYAREAIRRHGVVAGSRLAIRRVTRCHPFAAHGYDPVP
ncbi:MAG TPA: membrane protein insertion efficiency factor YidD [Candidatus Udaeobacter sp.]|jgi:putative membrane protein insertion efficiency factor|nr:membrane protein insertion efficiency factor YidD [Candidatus Udaeobacter sp.]